MSGCASEAGGLTGRGIRGGLVARAMPSRSSGFRTGASRISLSWVSSESHSRGEQVGGRVVLTPAATYRWTGAGICVANAHLFWDPSYEELKVGTLPKARARIGYHAPTRAFPCRVSGFTTHVYPSTAHSLSVGGLRAASDCLLGSHPAWPPRNPPESRGVFAAPGPSLSPGQCLAGCCLSAKMPPPRKSCRRERQMKHPPPQHAVSPPG